MKYMQIEKNKSGLFLMELIVVTLFLAITSTICIRIFLSARLLSSKSAVLTNAIIESQNTAELITGDRGSIEKVCDFYSTEEKDGSAEIYFDKDFDICDKESGVYVMDINSDYDGNFVVSDIVCRDIKNENEIYSLSIKTYKWEE